MTLDLPLETWRVLHGMLMETPMPARVSFPVIRDFEAALQAAQQPATVEEPHA